MAEEDELISEKKRLQSWCRIEKAVNVINKIVLIFVPIYIIYSIFFERAAFLCDTVEAYDNEDDYSVYSGRNVNEYWRGTLDEKMQTLYDEIKEAYLQFVQEIPLTVEDVTIDDVKTIYYYIKLDHPEIFWISSYKATVKIFDDDVINENKIIELTYRYSEEESIEIKNRIEPTYQAIIDGALEQENDYQKIKYVHDELINLATYTEYTEETRAKFQSIISIFDTGDTVCAGFSYGFKFIMDNLGIESLASWDLANDDVEDDENHIWNMVKLYGEWYNLDITWDEAKTEDGIIAYNYFLKTNEDFYTSHSMQAGIPE